jgi:hypothetical protein
MLCAILSARGTRTHYGHAQYPPIAPSLFALLAVALGILLILVQIRVLRYAYMQLGVSSGAAFLLLFGSLLGSYVNIPIAALGPESMVTERGSVRGLIGDWSEAVLEAPALVAGLDDVAVVGEAIEQGAGHFRIAKNTWPFAKGEIGRDDDRGSFIEPADQVEEQLAARLSEGQIAEFRRDRIGRRSSPWSTPPRSRPRTLLARRRSHRLRQARAAESSSRR